MQNSLQRHLKTLAINFFKLSDNMNIESLLNIDGIGVTPEFIQLRKFFLNKTNLKVLS